MNIMVLSQIEENIYALSLNEQLWLIERLAQHIRNAIAVNNKIDAQLITMANDPEIQKELHKIVDEES